MMFPSMYIDIHTSFQDQFSGIETEKLLLMHPSLSTYVPQI